MIITQKAEEKIKELLFKINRPVLENLRVVLAQQHDMLPKKFPDILADEPITFYLKIPDTKMADLTKPFTIKANRKSKPWKFSISPDQIQKGKYLDQLWARKKVEEISFHRAIGFIDIMQYEQRVRDLGLKYHLITKFTSLIAVDPIVSRDQSDPILSHQIPQNIPAG